MNGAKHLEIVLGDIERGTPPHAHPDLEQAVYILEGEAIAGINGVEHAAHPGDMVFFPANLFHSFKAVSDASSSCGLRAALW